MIDALIDRLYGAFDKSPQAEPLLSLSGSNTTWQVADRRITATSAYGTFSTALDTITLSELAAALTANGIPAGTLQLAADIPASVLLTSAGNTGTDGENVITGHRSVLWAILNAYATELQYAKGQVPQAVAQATLHTAEGEWLDYWGGYFGVLRLADQTDAAYLAWIVASVLRKKNNKYAIEKAVLDITGSQIEIKEPWQEIFHLDVSALSGAHALHDGVVAGYNLIRPVIPSSADWDTVMRVVQKTKPGGVLVSLPVRSVPALQVVVMPIEPVVWASRFFDHTFLVGKINTDALGRLVLDGYRSSINHLAAIFSLGSLGNADGANDVQHITPWRSVAKSAIALSDGYALGDINAVLGRGRIDRQIVPTPSLSDALALSDARAVVTVARVTEIVLDAHGALLVVAAPTSQNDSGLAISLGFFAMLNIDMGWTGAWSSDRAWNDHCIAGMVIMQEPDLNVLDDILREYGGQTNLNISAISGDTVTSLGPVTVTSGIEVLPTKTWRIE